MPLAAWLAATLALFALVVAALGPRFMRQAAAAIGLRAQAGARMLYEYLTEHLGPHDAGTAVNAAAGKSVPMPTPRPSQQTLSPADLAPAWRGPHPGREARGDGPA